jgi:hypothetical protein
VSTARRSSEAFRRSTRLSEQPPPGLPDTEIVEFGPRADFRQTMDVVGKNMESIG